MFTVPRESGVVCGEAQWWRFSARSIDESAHVCDSSQDLSHMIQECVWNKERRNADDFAPKLV